MCFLCSSFLFFELSTSIGNLLMVDVMLFLWCVDIDLHMVVM
jgi:hypothetical protein